MLLRPATDADTPEIVATLTEGFASYREFAPPGWVPATSSELVPNLRVRLAENGVWCLVAESPAGGLAGHVAFVPAAQARVPDPDPGLAHLWMLFVRCEFWGTGLAPSLHAAAVEEAGRRGFTAMRLFTPAGQARARRFYERAGWELRGAEIDEPLLGLQVVEYRLALVPPAVR